MTILKLLSFEFFAKNSSINSFICRVYSNKLYVRNHFSRFQTLPTFTVGQNTPPLAQLFKLVSFTKRALSRIKLLCQYNNRICNRVTTVTNISQRQTFIINNNNPPCITKRSQHQIKITIRHF